MNSDDVARTSHRESRAKSFLKLLKVSTSTLHEQLEAQPVMKVLVDPAITNLEYCRYLSLMSEVVKAYERLVLPQTAPFFKNTNYQSLASIERDFDVAGCSDNFIEPTYQYVVPANSAAIEYLLGIMYVMEGSKLGGRLILKNIQSALGYSDTDGASYLAGFGNETGSRWKYFLDRFSELVPDASGENLAIQGANDTFKSIHEFLAINQV